MGECAAGFAIAACLADEQPVAYSVEIKQQQNSEALLKAMNERQDVQLKLQSTVEGLSVAAITYYIVGLISYLAKGAQRQSAGQ